jgi:hypothetical protein
MTVLAGPDCQATALKLDRCSAAPPGAVNSRLAVTFHGSDTGTGGQAAMCALSRSAIESGSGMSRSFPPLGGRSTVALMDVASLVSAGRYVCSAYLRRVIFPAAGSIQVPLSTFAAVAFMNAVASTLRSNDRLRSRPSGSVPVMPASVSCA